MDMKAVRCIMGVLIVCLSASIVSAEWTLNPDRELTQFQEDMDLTFLSEPNGASFAREAKTFCWVSDIEHVIKPRTGKVFLADADPAYFLCGATVPGGTEFELFPYHYYGKDEEEKLGGKIRYKLVAMNRTKENVRVEIVGKGTTTTWDHSRTWAAAFPELEKSAQSGPVGVFTLKPGEVHVLWQEDALEGGNPWSAILLGRASGDLYVCDYAYRGEVDPGFAKAKQMPDLGLKPYEAPSFTRGTENWNSAEVVYFPEKRDKKGNLELSKVDNGLYSVAFASAPGGPVTNPWAYHLYDQTFQADVFDVTDPVSGKSHPFFGGNYPVMYRFPVSVVNDTDKPRTVNLFLCSNDFCCVHTLVGFYADGEFHHRLVPAVGWDQQWRVATTTIQPGQADSLNLTVVPLGSRWAGLIGTLEVASPDQPLCRDKQDAEFVALKDRTSRWGWKPFDFWLRRASVFLEENKSAKTGGIVFIGDSLTERFPLAERFPGVNVINRGIGGDRIEGLTSRLDFSVYDLKPRVIVLNIGINDLLFPKASVKELTRRYGLLLNKLKKNCPDTPVVMQTLLPTTGKFAKANESVVALNRDIRRLAFEHKYPLLDLYPQFVDDKGQLKAEYSEDGVHLTPAGYDKWVELLKPYVQNQ